MELSQPNFAASGHKIEIEKTTGNVHKIQIEKAAIDIGNKIEHLHLQNWCLLRCNVEGGERSRLSI